MIDFVAAMGATSLSLKMTHSESKGFMTFAYMINTKCKPITVSTLWVFVAHLSAMASLSLSMKSLNSLSASMDVINNGAPSV
jgi:hypothetical protein